MRFVFGVVYVISCIIESNLFRHSAGVSCASIFGRSLDEKAKRVAIFFLILTTTEKLLYSRLAISVHTKTNAGMCFPNRPIGGYGAIIVIGS